MLRIEIKTENAVFFGENKEAEICRILNVACGKIVELTAGQAFTADLRDINGNKVGTLSLD